jgi:hypothetical protein
MTKLDLSKKWTIYAAPPAGAAAAELAGYWRLLREQAGLKEGRPEIRGAEPSSGAGIFLKAAGGNPDKNGFSWRCEKGRIEISGGSVRGLWNGVFDFLAALGLRWPNPGQEVLPQAQTDGSCVLKSGKAQTPSLTSARERKRLFIDGKTGAKERTELVKWAARNKYDALVFSLRDKSLRSGAFINGGNSRVEYIRQIKYYHLIIEAGDRDLSLLLPRRLFFFHRDLFRMQEGRRKRDHHFCPTNPATTFRITEQVRLLMGRVLPSVTVPRVFHLLPDEGQENKWCACPACRAFNFAEQNLIAVNSAADALVKLDPGAALSFYDYKMEPEEEGIAPRGNMFRLPSPS